MTQEKLVGLAIISIENEITHNVDLKNRVADFDKKKSRKVNL